MKPIVSWCPELEAGAQEQAERLASLPFIFKHVALMPDCHQGYGMPIGGVIACENVVIPNAVGVDIGCGMHLVEFGHVWNAGDRATLESVCHEIRTLIPMGFSRRLPGKELPIPPHMPEELRGLVDTQAAASMGTLGGGNHFIEFQLNESFGTLSVMLHSGSRNLGKRVCDFYNAEAKRLNTYWHSSVDPTWDLAFLPADSPEGISYLRCMDYAVRYAKQNRETMARIIVDVVRSRFPTWVNRKLDCCHNYAALERHFGRNVWVHRKGATQALRGTLGLIPGSQGTCSYIVHGLENRDSFASCSHGAGRRMSRKQAQRDLDLAAEIQRMDSRGIIHTMQDVGDLDEAAGAYKDIDSVMANQKDLCEIVTRLTPLAVIKG